MENILPILTALVLLAIGLLFGIQALRLTFEQTQVWRLARSSRGWPATPGTIQTSQIVSEGARGPRAHPRVTYTYQVNRTQYEGSRINFSFAQVFVRKEAAEILAPYPPQARVTVYYDPARPAESTLEQRHSGLAGGLLVGLLVFLPTCLCLATGLIGLKDTLGK